MKNLQQLELVELNSLIGKFSAHIERKLIRTFFQEYKNHLVNLHHKLPHNALLIQKAKVLEELAAKIETVDPGTLKFLIQNHLSEIISELDTVNSELNA